MGGVYLREGKNGGVYLSEGKNGGGVYLAEGKHGGKTLLQPKAGPICAPPLSSFWKLPLENLFT